MYCERGKKQEQCYGHTTVEVRTVVLLRNLVGHSLCVKVVDADEHTRGRPGEGKMFV